MSSKLPHEHVVILLVEDSPGDVRLTRLALEEAKVANHLHVAGDGVEAMDYLHRRGAHGGAARPDLILLDLNLPRMDGREVLAEIKQDPDLKRIPVIVLTTSDAERDILKSYDLHANCYLVKPVDVNSFFEQIRSLEGFWLSIVRLPGDTAARAA
jgi:chemotaxis family two-component system response regulator Rcp1